MPKFNKPLPEMLNAVWASEALSQNNVYPDVNYVEEGWLQIKPPYEYENAINYKHDQFIAHINQLGVVEWDSETEYQANKSYVQSGNLIYKCIQTHTNRSPSTAGNETFWEVFEGNRQATEARRGTTKYATSPQTRTGSSADVSVTPKGLLEGFLGALSTSSGTLVGNLPFRNASGSRQEVKFQLSSHVFLGIASGTDTNPAASTNHLHRTKTVDVTFPEPFSSECTGVFPTGEDLTGSSEGSEYNVTVVSKNKNGATLRITRVSGVNTTDQDGVIRYLAVGI